MAPAVSNAGPNTPFAQRSEVALSLALLGVLVVLLVPLPPFLLDILLTLNLSLTILLLLVTLSATQPLDFSVFPSVLLLLTLFRLALNVATTRLILLHGNAGMIVSAFGGFVVGGSLIVGLVVFLILVIIQFVVITKGAGRVSEVAARFTLDAMPGKQMAIDAELNAGAIDEAEARRRREHLVREAEFYGAMDGASKFVRGDAIAGLIITAINLVGGVIIGMMNNLSFGAAIRTYSILTVGDGLIAQIPALIVATAAGILVTKATSKSNLGQEIGSQVLGSSRPLAVGAMILAGLGLAPGLPMFPFLVLASLLWILSRRMAAAAPAPPGKRPAADGRPTTGEPRPSPEGRPPIDEFLQVDRACIEIGVRLIPLVDPGRGIGLLDRIGGLRRDLANKHGFWIPPVRVRDNIQLPPEAYRILIGGREVGRGTLRPERWLAIDPSLGTGETPVTQPQATRGTGVSPVHSAIDGAARSPIDGEATTDPAFGLPARWISENDRQRAELLGHTVVDAPSVLITHLGEMLRRYSHELLSREDLKVLVDKVKETSPTVVDELIPNVLTMGVVHRVVTLLLEEHVPISNLVRIMESLAHHAPATKDPVELADRVRLDLGRTVCDRFRDEQGRFHAVVLDPRVELELRRALHEKNLVLDPLKLEKLIVKLGEAWRASNARGQDAAVLVDSVLRRPLRNTLARTLADLAVIAYQEVPSDFLLDPAAVIKPEDLGPGKPEDAVLRRAA